MDTNSCEIAHPVDLIQDYLHVMPLKSCILEGRSLNPQGKLPTRGGRILLWVEDLNAGNTMYSYSGPVLDEPNLIDMTTNDPRPLLLATWAENSMGPTGPTCALAKS